MYTVFGVRSASSLLVGPGWNPPSSATSAGDPQPLELGNGLREQDHLLGIAWRVRGRQDQSTCAAAGVLGDLGQLGHIAELVGLADLPLRIGLASGSNNGTNLSLIGSPATRWRICGRPSRSDRPSPPSWRRPSASRRRRARVPCSW